MKIKFKESIEKLDYPLAVIAYEVNKEIVFRIAYAGELFNKRTIENILSTIKELLIQVVKNIEEKEERLNYIDAKEERRIVEEWNKTDREYDREKTIQGVFEEQVERSKDRIAIVYEDKQLTYEELNKRANQIGRYIRRKYGIGADRLVGLCLDRSEHMLLGIMGILKGGGGYVPMDPNYPEDRIKYMMYVC